MVNYYIYAKDYSCSTHRVDYYHHNGLKTLTHFKNDVERIKAELLSSGELPTESIIIYLHWGQTCSEVSEHKTRETYSKREGKDPATNPDTIIHWLKEMYDICNEDNKIKLLYIITDGLIDSQCADKCFDLNKDMYYERVVFHAFNEQLNNIDLSVAASFFKSECVVSRNNELYDNINISEEFDYDKINVDNFETEKEQLKSYIKLKFIKTYVHDDDALKAVEKLKQLRGRLFKELSSRQEKSKIRLKTKDKNKFLHEFVNTVWYKSLTASDYDAKVDIEKSISTLINYIVSDAKSYSFDALKFDKKFDKTVTEESEPIVDVNFIAEQEIEFPDVIMDDEKGIPVIILTEINLINKIIFHNNTRSLGEVTPASFSKFQSTMECPLFLVNDQDISESIGYFYTLNVYKQLLANNTKTDPRTRKAFHGGLVLTDTDQFDKYNDYILSATYFGRKKVKYNIGLFYFVLWKICENKEWMDGNVLQQLQKYTMRRISKTVCKIGLSSLPLDPQEITSLPTALWYCVELSSYIFKNDPLFFKHERLRGYFGVANHMIEILKFFNYDLDLEAIEKRRELISYVMTLKRIDKYKEKVYYLLEKIFKTVDGFLVSEIENPANLYILNYLKFNHKEIFNDNVVMEKNHLKDYIHLMHMSGSVEASKAGKGTFEISKKTFRPFFVIDQKKSFYTELVRNTKKVVISNDDDKDKIEVTYDALDSLGFDRIVSLYKLYIDCVLDSEKYPTFFEYVEYILKKKMFHEELVTIFPPNVYLDAKDIYERYQKIVPKINISKFIKVSKAYVNRIERIKAEERVKFNSDNEISDFISNEEVKVKLLKKTQNT